MKKIISVLLIAFIALIVSSCVTSNKKTIEHKNADELNNDNKIYLNELVKNQEYIQKIEKLNSDYNEENITLLDELELAIQKEKQEKYNEGFEHGKKIATDELIKSGYVILKIEDLQKYGLWGDEK